MACRVLLEREAEDHLARLRASDRSRVAQAIVKQLSHQPTVETRNCKPMRPNDLATWELRVRSYRVYYDVDEGEQTVWVRAIGLKVGNRVYIGGEEVDLHE